MSTTELLRKVSEFLTRAAAWDVSTWASIVASIIAAISAIIALRSNSFSKMALKLAERQEQRQQPSLTIYLRDSYVRYVDAEPRHRIYGFWLLISNTSESDNSIAHLDLLVTYTMPSGIQMTLKVPSDSTLGLGIPDVAGALIIPTRIDGHQTIGGWSYFKVGEALLAESVVEGYTIAISDVHGGLTTIEKSIVQELVDENEFSKKGRSNAQ